MICSNRDRYDLKSSKRTRCEDNFIDSLRHLSRMHRIERQPGCQKINKISRFDEIAELRE
ncbi:MAG TPA: hypothetical protein DCL47_00685 [Pantoea agglomerans]|nr:hypothetical protein D0A61_12755 [Pantoea agglomerans]RNA77657.1 hypothetical protein EBO33_05865 [[Curtobacterium] plantarum]HAH12041.1 hypothetical protein [Pantoea agglomerans]HBP94815.1 hypothetical protein [Pantoea agglomerans]